MKLKTQLYLLWAMLLSLPSFGQTSFISTYPTANGARVASTIALSDGNILSGGKTTSFTTGDYDILLLKTDPSGDVLWTKTYGNSEDNEVLSMAALSTNAYAVLAKDYSGGVPYYTLMIIDLSGAITAQRTFSVSTGLSFPKISALSNGNVLVCGTTMNKIILTCLDNTCATVWTKDISVGASGVTINSVKATEMTNGNIAIICNTDYGTMPNLSFYLNIVSNAGSIISSQLFSTTFDISSNKVYCSPTTGNLYICGTANSSRFLILKLDNSGSLTWVKSWNTTHLTYAGTLDATFDPATDDITILGYTIAAGFEVDHYDSDGTYQWSNGGPTFSETPIAITGDANGNFFVSGTVATVATGFQDILLSYVPASGHLCSHAPYTVALISNYTATASTVSFNDNGSPTLTDNPITYTSQSPTLTKSVSCTFNVGVDESSFEEFFSLRSNIISDQLIIDSKTGFSANELISVSDLSGRVVYTVNGVEGNTQMAISTNKLSAGAYLISVMKNGSRMTKKIIVQR